MRWYYFIRSGDRLVRRREGARLPPRPADANPDNGDPLTPWYEVTDHWDDKHVHVRARSDEEAAQRARFVLTLSKWERTASPERYVSG